MDNNPGPWTTDRGYCGYLLIRFILDYGGGAIDVTVLFRSSMITRCKLEIRMRRLMIISHKHKFIFLKPYKVAGSSFEFALSSILGPRDLVTYLSKDEEKKRWIELGVKERNNRKTLPELLKDFSFQNKRDFKSLRWPKLFHPHAPAEDIKSFLGDALWEQYTKVSLIRNPWDYLLSAYYWNPSNQNRKPFEQWIKENIQIVGGNNRQYYINGECVIDVFLRHEHLLSDLSALPVSEGDKQKVKLYLSKARFKSGFRKTDKSEETKMLKNASFVDPIIGSLCELEVGKFGYKKTDLKNS